MTQSLFLNQLSTDLQHEEIYHHQIPELPNFLLMFSEKLHGTGWEKILTQWEAVIFSLIVALLVSLFFSLACRKREIIPYGVQNFLESIVEVLRGFVVEIIGPAGEKYLPFLGTLFIYILSMNYFGLIPLMKSPSSNLNITAAQALCVFFYVQYLNVKHFGLFGYLFHLAGSPKSTVEWILAPLMFPIELITQISRPLTLAFRLFGNIMGEDILISYFALLGASLLPFFIPVPLQIPFLFLALFTGFVQALVFTLLTAVYILLSMPDANQYHAS